MDIQYPSRGCAVSPPKSSVLTFTVTGLFCAAIAAQSPRDKGLTSGELNALERAAQKAEADFDFSAARELRQRQVELGEAALGKDHWWVRDKRAEVTELAWILSLPNDDQARVIRADRMHAAAAQTSEGEDYARAAKHMVSAIEEYKQIEGCRKTIRYARAIGSLAMVQVSLGELGRAESLLRESLQIATAILGPDNPAIAETHIRLADVLNRQKRRGEAIRNLVEARTILDRLPDPGVPRLRLLGEIGELHETMHDLGNAQDAYEQLIAVLSPLAVESLEMAEAASDLGNVYRRRGDLNKAAEVLAWAQSTLKDLPAANSPAALRTANRLGLVYQAQGKDEQAEEQFQRICKSLNAPSDSASMDYAASIACLGMLYLSCGSYDAARPLLQQAQEICGREKQSGSLQGASIQCCLGQLEMLSGNTKSAIAQLEHAAELAQSIAPSHEYASFLVPLAAGYRCGGELERAEKALQTADELTKDEPDKQTSRLIVIEGLGLLKVEMGAHAEAAALLKRALLIRQENMGLEHFKIIEPLEAYSKALYGCGKNEDAAYFAERAKALREKYAQRQKKRR